MDTTQLLLSTAVTITTILLIVVSIQLMSLLKQLKTDHVKNNNHVVRTPEIKKDKVVRKRVSLTSLLEKMKTRISHPHSAKKRFFKS